MFKAILLGTAGMFFSATLIEWAGVNGIASIQNIEKADQIIPMILQRGMNPFLASIFIAGIVAAGMSTIDGILVTTTGAVTRDIYQKIMERLDGRDVRIVVDATKDLLLNVLGHHPFLIKPNNHELGDIFGVKLSEREEVVPYAKKLQEKGAVNVLVSMAGTGAVLLAEDGSVYAAEAPKGTLKNGVGAGDSMVAGFLAGYGESGDYEHAFRMGLAAGSASAFSEQLATKDEIKKVYETCKITKIG